MKELYGVGVLFFYFLKWPILLGLPLLYNNGLQNNIVLNILWLYCCALALKDLYTFIQKHSHNKKEN
jgi:hypothetical protein